MLRRARQRSVPAMDQRHLTCRHCGDVIGTYEPLVALFGSLPVRTSRVAAETEQLFVRPCFHAHCFATRDPDTWLPAAMTPRGSRQQLKRREPLEEGQLRNALN